MKKSFKCFCGLEKEISQCCTDDVGYPIFSCPIHGPDKRNEWAIWWSVYKDRWKEEKYWDNNADKLSCLIGYFCDYYKNFFGYSYVFSFVNPNPYKDKDFVMGRRILNMFGGNAKEARIYIKWVFAKRIKTSNYPIYSFGFFASQKFVNEYFYAKARSKILKRSSKLPQDFLDWCKNNYPAIFETQDLETWNDLNGLISHIKSYGENCLENLIINEAVNRKLLFNKYSFKKLED